MTDEATEEVADQVTTTTGAGRGIGKNEMVEGYLPGEDHWAAKTLLDLEDPARVAALRQFDEMFPEAAELQPVLDGFLDEFLPAKTSIGGASREEAQSIFEAMFGAGGDEKQKGRVLAEAFGVDVDDD